MDKEIENAVLELDKNVNEFMQNNKKMEADMMTNENNKTMPLSENTTAGKQPCFDEYIRKGNSFLKKSLSSKEGGGEYFIPYEAAIQINDRLKELSPMRAISKIITISSNAVEFIINAKMPEAGWSGSEEIKEETGTPEIQKIRIPVHEIYAKPRVDQKLLDDSQIDIEEWLISKISEKIAALENHAFINGDGQNKPHGFLQYESEDKRERNFGKLQHFYSGAAGGFPDNDSALNVLIEMACSIRPFHVKNAKWIMSRSALAEIRKVKNKDGMSLWQPSLVESNPANLLGYPVIIDDDMPELTKDSESTSVAFGDFSSGYQIVDRQGLKILRDPYTSKPFVEFYTTKRTGGKVIDSDAIKLLKFTEKPE